MKISGVRFLVVFVLLAGASFAFANPFKSKIITSSALQISVPSDHSLKITNFSQEGGTDRGVVTVTFNGEGNSGTANVLTAIRIDFSTGGNAQNFPEIANKVIIAGPAEVTVAPVTGATLFITYRKESNEGGSGNGGGGGGSGSPTPTVFPFFSPSPTP
ncbi:MAG: hypothetical protein DME79_05875 [Verrucomicrobia bacterium]|nr:MAG: hypothetical protein DME79_05875 [Verrucomicrobiota bacterium]